MSSGDAPVGVVIPAAGSGHRMGGVRKPFLQLLGRPVLAWTLEPFLAHPAVGTIVVALSPEDAASPPDWLTALAPDVRIVGGGETRTDSVESALRALPVTATAVMVHDAARPLVRSEWIDACAAAVAEGIGGVLGYPATDSMKRADGSGLIARTEDRDGLWQVQTPQAFPRRDLEDAYTLARETGGGGTDDASLVERLGRPIRLIRGGTDNIKITYPEDLIVAEALIRRRQGTGSVPESRGAREAEE